PRMTSTMVTIRTPTREALKIARVASATATAPYGLTHAPSDAVLSCPSWSGAAACGPGAVAPAAENVFRHFGQVAAEAVAGIRVSVWQIGHCTLLGMFDPLETRESASV